MEDSAGGENRPPDKEDEGDGQAMSHADVSKQPSGESVDRTKRLQSEKLGHRRVKGDVITYKRTPTNTLMLSIQLGLEQSIGKITNKPKRDILMQHFSDKEDVDFPPEGSVQTPAHVYGFFKFKTYAPLCFRHFREDFHIRADDFLVSLCNEQLRELSNPGASGSVFYLTNDDEFIIKTVQHKEATFLRSLLCGYYMNLIQNKRTLLPKFYGLYTYINNFAGNIRIVVMNNLLPSGIRYHEKYDLKGSTLKRLASDKELAKKSPTLKDLDFRRMHPEGFYLSQDKYNSVMESMKRDCMVLESFKIMDYSLLMAVHNIDEELRSRGMSTAEVTASPEHSLEQRASAGAAAAAAGDDPVATRRQFFSIVQERGHEEVEALPYAIPDGGISARNANGDRLVIYIGIIDILQNYRFRKKLEHSLKAVAYDGDTVSVCKPKYYAQRFTDFFSTFVFHPKSIVKRKASSVRRPRLSSGPVSPTGAERFPADVSRGKASASSSAHLVSSGFPQPNISDAGEASVPENVSPEDGGSRAVSTEPVTRQAEFSASAGDATAAAAASAGDAAASASAGDAAPSASAGSEDAGQPPQRDEAVKQQTTAGGVDSPSVDARPEAVAASSEAPESSAVDVEPDTVPSDQSAAATASASSEGEGGDEPSSDSAAKDRMAAAAPTAEEDDAAPAISASVPEASGVGGGNGGEGDGSATEAAAAAAVPTSSNAEPAVEVSANEGASGDVAAAVEEPTVV